MTFTELGNDEPRKGKLSTQNRHQTLNSLSNDGLSVSNSNDDDNGDDNNNVDDVRALSNTEHNGSSRVNRANRHAIARQRQIFSVLFGVFVRSHERGHDASNCIESHNTASTRIYAAAYCRTSWMQCDALDVETPYPVNV